MLLFRKIKPYQIADVFKYLQYLTFFKGKNKHFLKKIVSRKTNQNNEITISEAIGDNKDIVLKVDIEGDEYMVLNEINKNSDKLNLVIIEFHNLQKNLKKLKNFLKKTKLRNIHISINNYGKISSYGVPEVIEMTLINPKRFKIRNIRTNRNYPLDGLDFKNYKRGPDIKINFKN